MKNKFTVRIENIKNELMKKFGKDKFEIIYSFYKKEEKVINYKIKFFYQI